VSRSWTHKVISEKHNKHRLFLFQGFSQQILVYNAFNSTKIDVLTIELRLGFGGLWLVTCNYA